MRAIPCPITPAELHNLTHEAKLTDEEIAARIPGATVKRVRSWRRRFSIKTLPRWARNDVIPIEGRLRSLLVGSMLGDGRLVRRVNATQFIEGHCEKQRPYLEWKAAMWGPWVRSLDPIPDKRGFPHFRFDTYAHADLNAWQALFYTSTGKGWKRLTPAVVDHVDPFALAIWYLDDGHAGWWPGITFGADPASREVACAIFEKFGLTPRWQPLVRNTGHFHFEREDTAERFIEIIRPHVPECMNYKLGPFGFQGPHFQVRQRTPEEVLRVMATANVPLRVMAERLGVGASTIDRKLKEFGIHHARKTGRPSSH